MRRVFLSFFNRYVTSACVVVWLVVACSVEQNTITSNFYHNTTAHFNSYFYADEKIKEIEKKIISGMDDDPTQILPLFARIDTVQGKAFKKDTDEVIKMSSISIQRHPNSKWVNKNYLLVGQARLYSGDYLNAKLTFKYINTKSKDRAIRHRALLWLIRTYTEEGDYDRAKEAIQYIEKEKLNDTNKKFLCLEKAHFYQRLKDDDKMVRSLAQADPYLTRADRHSRIYFIIGQVYQKLGFTAQAYQYYKKTIETHPEYEIDFYARLNMAQVAEISNPRAVQLVKKQFLMMIKDSKNVDFLDKIYYELGWFEQKQRHFKEAETYYSLAAKIKKSTRVQALSYLRIGQIEFDSLKQYAKAQPYYDSAVAILPKDFENYDDIKARDEMLDEFVQYSNTIKMNDSLLQLAKTDTATLAKQLRKKLAPKPSTGKKKKQRVSTPFIPDNVSTQVSAGGDWYFGNLASMALGKSEFDRVWGTIPLQDNWRRSIKSLGFSLDTASATKPQPDKPVAQPTTPKDETEEKVKGLLAKVPYEKAAQAKLEKEMEEAYFKLGDLYFFKLNERDNAVHSLQTILSRFPNSPLVPETLFKLHRIFIDKDPALAEKYKQELITRFPRNDFARSLINPDYWKEDLKMLNQQKAQYEKAYHYYLLNDLRHAYREWEAGMRVGETEFLPRMQFLKVLLDGRTKTPEEFQDELRDWIQKNPQDSLVSYAQKLSEASARVAEKIKMQNVNIYAENFSTPHWFIVIHPEKKQQTYAIAHTLEKYNKQYDKKWKLTTSNLALDAEYIMTMVEGLPDGNAAMEYFDSFKQTNGETSLFQQSKIYTFVISNSNFQILYQQKRLDEYLTFFDRHYQK